MSDNQNRVYPLKMDEKVYSALQNVCKLKGITVKDGLRTAVSLFIADNIHLIFDELNKDKEQKEEVSAENNRD